MKTKTKKITKKAAVKKAAVETWTRSKPVKAIAPLNTFKMEELVKLYNKHTDGKKIKAFKNKAQAVRVISKLLKSKGIEVQKPEVKKATKKAGTSRPRGESKMQKIRDFFTNNTSGSVQEISDYSGYGKKQVSEAMNILKYDRTPPHLQLHTTYDRETKRYYLKGHAPKVSKKVAKKAPAKKAAAKKTSRKKK